MHLMVGSLDSRDSGCLCSLFPSLAGLNVFFSEMLASEVPPCSTEQPRWSPSPSHEKWTDLSELVACTYCQNPIQTRLSCEACVTPSCTLQGSANNLLH